MRKQEATLDSESPPAYHVHSIQPAQRLFDENTEQKHSNKKWHFPKKPA